jgi:hypothetical protein
VADASPGQRTFKASYLSLRTMVSLYSSVAGQDRSINFRSTNADSGMWGSDAQGGAQLLSDAQSDKAWSLPLGAAVLGVRQLGLSGWEQAECFALENEIGAWQQAGHLSSPAAALRCSSQPPCSSTFPCPRNLPQSVQ